MSTIIAQSIIDRAGKLLQDITKVRWTEPELLEWLNDGQREIVNLRPDANPKNIAVVMVTGTKQNIPATGIRLIDIVRNMGTDGLTPGRGVRIVDREVLDSQLPDWHASTPAAESKHYCFDARDPKQFYVYPPQPAVSPGFLELVYSEAPADILIGAVITIDDVYSNAILDYIMYRAYSKDAEYAANPARATSHYQAFALSLGMDEKNLAKNNPNRQAPPFNPNSSGAK